MFRKLFIWIIAGVIRTDLKNKKSSSTTTNIQSDYVDVKSLGDEKSSPKDLFDNIIKEMYELNSFDNIIANIKELFKKSISNNKNWFEWIKTPIKSQIIHNKNHQHSKKNNFFDFSYINIENNKKIHITIHFKENKKEINVIYIENPIYNNWFKIFF